VHFAIVLELSAAAVANSVESKNAAAQQRATNLDEIALCSALRRQFVVTKSGLPSLPVMDLAHISLICLTTSAGIGT